MVELLFKTLRLMLEKKEGIITSITLPKQLDIIRLGLLGEIKVFSTHSS